MGDRDVEPHILAAAWGYVNRHRLGAPFPAAAFAIADAAGAAANEPRSFQYDGTASAAAVAAVEAANTTAAAAAAAGRDLFLAIGRYEAVAADVDDVPDGPEGGVFPIVDDGDPTPIDAAGLVSVRDRIGVWVPSPTRNVGRGGPLPEPDYVGIGFHGDGTVSSAPLGCPCGMCRRWRLALSTACGRRALRRRLWPGAFAARRALRPRANFDWSEWRLDNWTDLATAAAAVVAGRDPFLASQSSLSGPTAASTVSIPIAADDVLAL